jgi:hypothetical protein
MAMAVAMARTAVVGCRAAHTQLYEVLKVDKAATPAQLKSAYRNLAKDYHPDVSSHPDAHARFIELSSAYEVRAFHDLWGGQISLEIYFQTFFRLKK